MPIVDAVKFVESNNTDEVEPLLVAAYAAIKALDTPVILETIYNLVVTDTRSRYYSILIHYTYDYTEPPPET